MKNKTVGTIIIFMEDLKFEILNLDTDKQEINAWQTKYSGTPGWQNIFNYVLEHGLIYSLAELIETNYERIAIGTDEVKFALTVKLNSEVIGFVICQEFAMDTNEPELFMQYLVIRPDMQHKGFGTLVHNKLPFELEKLTGKRPVKCHCLVDKNNTPSLKLLNKNNYKPAGLSDEGFYLMQGYLDKSSAEKSVFSE